MNDCKICCLYSGSRGNCTYISAGGARILIDAGKSAKALCSALKEINVDIDDIDAIFITHEHRDHISALQTLSHKHRIPIYMVLESASVFYGLMDEKLCSCFELQLKSEFAAEIKGLTVTAFPTPHDSRASVGYRLTFKDESGNDISIGYATDTGCVTDTMRENLTGCFAVVIESNHDVEMLQSGPYPYELKQRIASARGHLSNEECACFADYLVQNGTRNIMLAHLSEENNTPDLAYCETIYTLGGEDVKVCVASQDAHVWLLGDEQNKYTD